MSLYLPGEMVQTAPRSWPTASAWLYGYVRTDHPGYRSVSWAGVTQTIASGTYRWDDYLTAAATAFGAFVDIASDTSGRVGLVSQTTNVPTVWLDRFGWLCGLGFDAGETSTIADYQSPFVPPAGIPLLGLVWSQVSVERERELSLDRSRRSSGYVFGGARIWRCTLTMTRWSYEALCTGWCLRGKVSLVGSTSSAMSSSVPAGVLTGQVLGLEGAPVWDGPTQEICRVTMLVAGSTS